MVKILQSAAVLTVIISIMLTASCKKSDSVTYVEPITIINPDTLHLNNLSPGTVSAIKIQFTTDRPILWAKCMYEIDSPNAPFYRYYPDTLFFSKLDTTPSQASNKYTYTGSYTIPPTLTSRDSIRFDVKMAAYGNPSSPDTLFYDKQFTITVR